MSSTTSPSGSRPRLTTALVAAGAGALLLTAGGTTFATWSDTEDVPGAAITSGELSLTAADDGTWTNSAGTALDPAEYLLVPGDVLTYQQSVTVHAKGDLLQATLTTNLDEPAVSGGSELAAALVQGSTFTVNEEAQDDLDMAVTEANDGDELTVELTVELPDSVTGTTAQDERVDLSALQVQLTQDSISEHTSN